MVETNLTLSNVVVGDKKEEYNLYDVTEGTARIALAGNEESILKVINNPPLARARNRDGGLPPVRQASVSMSMRDSVRSGKCKDIGEGKR